MNTKLFIKSVLLSALIAQSGQAFAAQYEVKEIASLDKYRQHFSTGLNDSGTVVGITRDVFNFSFYLESYLESYKASCQLSDDELVSGDFDASSTLCLMSALSGNSTNPLYQKLGNYKSFINSGNETSLAILSDVEDAELGDYTYSNDEQLNAINSSGIAVGSTSAPFETVGFNVTSDNGVETELKLWQRDYKTRAAIYLGANDVALIEPTFNEYGGITSAVDISNSGYVAGYSSTEFSSTSVETLLESDCDGTNEPLLVCVWTKQNSGELYIKRPYIWQINNSGEVESSTEFDLGITPTTSQTGNYEATITAVNEFGVGVGYGDVHNSDENIRTQPLLFGTDGTQSLIDNDLYYAGYATDINSSNIVVGTVQSIFDNALNDEFFVYDTVTQEFDTPSTFYLTAESTANAINDLGKVIGEAEYEITTETTRRKHGFIYDVNSREFNDINDLIGCNSEFEIVAMNDINNNNQIAATALKLVEYRDSSGEVVYDSIGEAITEEVAVSVLLTPIVGGEIENCSNIDDEDYERKGLSTAPWLLIFLSSLLYIRRRSI